MYGGRERRLLSVTLPQRLTRRTAGNPRHIRPLQRFCKIKLLDKKHRILPNLAWNPPFCAVSMWAILLKWTPIFLSVSGNDKILKRVTSASLLLLLFCWAATAIGKIGAWHSQVITTLPLNQLPCNTAIFSEDDRNPAGGHCLSRIPHNRKITALIRLHICGGSEVARNGLVPPDVPPPESRQPYPPQAPGNDGHYARLSRILLRTLQLPPHQNRLGGWKESNILYRGQVTYHPTLA